MSKAHAPAARLDIPLDRPGRSSGALLIPGDGKTVRLPVFVFTNGTGPTLLLTGAIHGDEWEGPIALARLAGSFDPSAISGRLIVMPFVNVLALAAGRRRGPGDDLDLNRCFPGQEAGSITERIAHALSSLVLPCADVVIDLHTGGTNSVWIPCAMMHPLADTALHARTLELVAAMRVPAGVVIDESDKPGMFDTHVERLGKPFVCCEFGGGMVSPETVSVADAGIRNAMRHLGMLGGRAEVPRWRGRSETRLLEIPDLGYAMEARTQGIYEPLLEVGDSVDQDQEVGRIFALDAPDRAPEPVLAPATGILFHRRAFARVEAGHRVGMVARPLMRA